MKVLVTQVFDLKLLLTYCLTPTKILLKKLKKFTCRNKIVYFPLLSRRAQALPGLAGDTESRTWAQLASATLVHHCAHTLIPWASPPKYEAVLALGTATPNSID